MIKKLVKISLFAFAMIVSMSTVSCGGGKNKASSEDSVDTDEPKYTERSVDAEIFSSMPVEGDKAEYFSISSTDGTQIIKITGAPDEEYGSQGVVKATVDITILKSLNDEVEEWDRYGGPKLVLLDENHEEIEDLSLSKTDLALLEAELAKATPGKISVIFKDDFYSRDYNKIFDKTKYVQLKSLDLKGKKEKEKEEKMREAELAKEEASAAREAKSSRSYDSDDSDDDEPAEKSRWQKVKDKVKDKTKGLREKATEKIDNWLDD